MDMDIGSCRYKLAELAVRPKCHDWNAKAQHVCRAVWTAIGQVKTADPQVIANMRILLEDAEAFEVAKLVIPAFRDLTSEDGFAAESDVDKREILRHLQQHHAKSAAAEGDQKPRDNDPLSALYRAERQAYFDADIHRTRLFFRQMQQFDDTQKDLLRAWLEDCPVRKEPDAS